MAHVTNEKTADSFQVKYRRYSEKNARIAKVNHTTLIGMTIVEGFLLLAFGLQFLTQSDANVLRIGPPILFLIVGLIANWTVYLKNKSSQILRIVMMAVFMLAYGWLNLAGGAVFVTLYAIPTLYCLILYSDKVFSRITCFLGVGIMVVRMIVGFATKGVDGMSADFTTIFVVILCFIFFWLAAASHKNFEHDMMHTMLDEQKLQGNMMEDILQTVEVAQRQVQEVVSLMEQVSNSNDIMNQSLQEIATGTLSTAESIQDQTVMTENIRNAIEVTDENATAMAEAAGNSAKQAKDSTHRMEEMQNQSEQIEASGAELAQAMQQLKDKVAEVNNITQVIFSISSQTNLLALNASIESARAGEAGRGFAVVADQIRQLAEQTKQSTEQIAQITSQLTQEADLAATLVEKSVTATTEQKELIGQNVVVFEEMARQSDEASQKAADLDEEISRLKEANNKIVESIAQLSAVSEEVTANTQQATELSDNNVEQLGIAATKITEIKEIIMKLKKYQELIKK